MAVTVHEASASHFSLAAWGGNLGDIVLLSLYTFL